MRLFLIMLLCNITIGCYENKGDQNGAETPSDTVMSIPLDSLVWLFHFDSLVFPEPE